MKKAYSTHPKKKKTKHAFVATLEVFNNLEFIVSILYNEFFAALFNAPLVPTQFNLRYEINDLCTSMIAMLFYANAYMLTTKRTDSFSD